MNGAPEAFDSNASSDLFARPRPRPYCVCIENGRHPFVPEAHNVPPYVEHIQVSVQRCGPHEVSLLLGTLAHYVATLRKLTLVCQMRRHHSEIVIPRGVRELEVHTWKSVQLNTRAARVRVHEYGMSSSHPESDVVAKCSTCAWLGRAACGCGRCVGDPKAVGSYNFVRTRVPRNRPFEEVFHTAWVS